MKKSGWRPGPNYPTSWPNGGSEAREQHFSLRNNVAVYGGFDGTETSRDDRDIVTNETILSGDIGTVNDDSDNCYHVFYHPIGTDLDDTAVLNGIIITRGNATGESYSHHFGGGMQNYGSSPSITNCTFLGNSASYGGGMYNIDCSSTITNCTFSGNSAGNSGGGIYTNFSSSAAITNCILWGNTAPNGNEIYYNSNSTLTFSHCDVQGGISGLGTDNGGNINADPLFVRNPGTNGDDDYGDLHLTDSSPCIDKGDNDFFTAGDTDMDGEIRITNGIIDIGADEWGSLDTDGDGLSDYDETNIYSTNPLISDADADTDGDGLTNVDEVNIYGTDPTTSDADTDTDGDGLTNVDEIDIYGTDHMDTDSDHDGLDDYLELYLWGNCWNDDPDQDGLINLLDDDSNGDGINDRDAFYAGNWDADCDGDDTVDSGETDASTGSSGGGGGGGCFIGTLF